MCTERSIVRCVLVTLPGTASRDASTGCVAGAYPARHASMYPAPERPGSGGSGPA